jgi:hypothetical protein
VRRAPVWLSPEAENMKSQSAPLSPDFSPRSWKDGALQAAEKPYNAVILSAAKDLTLFIFKAMRDSSSPLLLRMTALSGFSAACLAPPSQRRPDYFQVPRPAQLAAASCAGRGTNREREPRFRRG